MRTLATASGIRLRPGLAVADRLVVRLRPGLSGADPLAPVAGRLRRALGQGQFLVDLPPNTDLATAIAKLRGRPGVDLVEPDLVMYPSIVPNDPEYSQQHHLPLISAPQGWDVVTGTPVVIAVIDSGVDLDHPDLVSKILTNSDEVAGNGQDDDSNGYVDDVRGWDFYSNNANANPTPDGRDDNSDGTPDEQVSHGTLVSGLAAAATNNGYGVAGVSWGALIMPLQVFPDDGGTAVSTVIEAINYAVRNGAKVINLSIGGGYAAAFTAPLTAAYNAGCVVVVAGGNSGNELTDSQSTWESPVCNDGDNVFTENHLIGVAATDQFDRKASYSNFDSSTASFIDVAGPGEALYGPTAYFPSFAGFTSFFGTNSGTSFSCPVVSGLAALVLSRHPGFSPAEVRQAIVDGADNIDATNPGYVGKLGGGRINVARTVGVALPPKAALDLRAADTTGDDGGSLTVTWLKSPDDGAGADSVESYEVLRRTAGAELAAIATLPKGSQEYVDATTTDGTDYYYLIRVSDGSLSSDTAEVGPARSRNDAPPPLVANLKAVDRPNDDGGAIRLSWDTYTPPADFKQFVVYRATHDFTSVQGLTPLANLTNSGAKQYLDLSVADGADYYYAVAVRDTVGNEERDLNGTGPVQSYANGAVTFAAGLHLVGAPVVPANLDPAALFGVPPAEFSCARWLPSQGVYSSYAAGVLPEPMQLGLGRGYWVNLAASVQVQPEGSAAPAGDFELALEPGWHMLANPFLGPIDFGEATVTFNGATMDLLSADASGVLAAFAWVWDPTPQSYSLAYPDFSGGTHLIPPWRGFWVFAREACVLTIVRPLSGASVQVASAAAPAAPAAPLQVDYVLPLRVSSGGASSACYVGTANRRLTAPGPPSARPAPAITAAVAGASPDPLYAVALAQTGPSAIIWDLKVSQLAAGSPVRLAAPDLSRLPTDRIAVLEDLAAGRTVYLRSTAAYDFTPRAGEKSRAFRLTVSQRQTGSLAVTAVTAQQSRGGNTQVMFTLSRPADCTVSVMNLAGRTVRVVEQGAVRPAGSNVALWDGRGQTGTLTPPGLYLLQVQARGESGESVRALTSLRLQR